MKIKTWRGLRPLFAKGRSHLRNLLIQKKQKGYGGRKRQSLEVKALRVLLAQPIVLLHNVESRVGSYRLLPWDSFQYYLELIK